MKKIIFSFLLILSAFFCCFAGENFLSVSLGVSSGVPFYQSEEVIENQELLEDGSRVIVGGLASLNLNPIEQVSFFLGTDLLCDLNFQKESKANHISFDIPLGLKLYPGFVDGLSFGVAYVYGFRYDYYNFPTTAEDSEEPYEPVKSTSPWGNGFKFMAEYNFAHANNKNLLPTIGMYWKRMPRGENTFDNQICAYICENF